MITVIAGYEPKAFFVQEGVELQLDPQDPVNGRQRVLRVLNKEGITVALFATWTSATRENDPEPGDGFHVAKNPLLPRDNDA